MRACEGLLLVEFTRIKKLGAHILKSRALSTTYAWLALIFIALVVLAIMGWMNFQLVKGLPQESEFLANWEFTRAMIFRGENPYNSPDVEQFTSPLPVVLFYSPFALIENYQIARAAWITVSQVAAAIFAILCIRMTSWQIKHWLAALVLILAIFWFPAVSVYMRGSQTALIAVLFGSSLFALKKQNDELSGILLGLAALQPHVTFISVLLVLLWAGSHRRWTLHFWAGVIFLFISGFGMIFFPSWPADFFWSTLRYIDFSPGKAIIETTTRWWPGVGLQVGWGILILAIIVLITEWWLVWGKSIKRLVWVVALTLILTIWIGIETNIDHIFMLMLPLVVIFMAWNRRWGRSGQIFVILVTGILLPSLWWAFIVFSRQGIRADMNPILMIGFPLLTLIGIYWVRWWFLRPMYLDESQTFIE